MSALVRDDKPRRGCLTHYSETGDFVAEVRIGKLNATFIASPSLAPALKQIAGARPTEVVTGGWGTPTRGHTGTGAQKSAQAQAADRDL